MLMAHDVISDDDEQFFEDAEEGASHLSLQGQQVLQRLDNLLTEDDDDAGIGMETENGVHTGSKKLKEDCICVCVCACVCVHACVCVRACVCQGCCMCMKKVVLMSFVHFYDEFNLVLYVMPRVIFDHNTAITKLR